MVKKQELFSQKNKYNDIFVYEDAGAVVIPYHTIPYHKNMKCSFKKDPIKPLTRCNSWRCSTARKASIRQRPEQIKPREVFKVWIMTLRLKTVLKIFLVLY